MRRRRRRKGDFLFRSRVRRRISRFCWGKVDVRG
jgi:hypothetical protein